MQKLANSVFGNEAMRFVKESDIGGEHIALWESWKKDDEGNSKLRLQVTSSGGRLKEVRITEMVDGKALVTRFDSSYKLHGWEPLFKNEAYEKLAEQQRRDIPEFLRSIIPAHDIRESPKEVFYPYFLKDEPPQKKEFKPAPRVFKETGKITSQGPGTLTLCFPEEVADKMGLRGGVQGAWAKEGESLILTPLEGVHYPVKISRESLSLSATIPQEMVLSMKLEQGMRMELSHEGEKIEVKEAEGAPRRTRRIRFLKESNNFRITIPERIAQNMNLNVDRHGEWFSDGEKLSLELVDNAPFIMKIQQKWYPYTTNANSIIPQELADSLGLEKDMRVSFRINDKGQLVISPVVITPSKDVSLQEIPNRYRRIYLTDKVASELHLTGKMSCRWDEEGDSLVMTPLKERSIQTKITLANNGSFQVVIPGDMQLAVGLKPEDFVKWMEKEGQLTLKKVNLSGVTLITSISSDKVGRVVFFPNTMASELQLEGKKSCKWELEGKVLVMTPLEKTAIQTKVMKHMPLLQVTLPKEVQLACGLKVGEYAAWEEKDGLLYLRKVERDAPGARKFNVIGGTSAGIDIPKEITDKRGLKAGMYCVWRPDEGKALVEFREENPHISKIVREPYDFKVSIPRAIEEFRKGDYILMQVRDGKLYLKRQEDFPKEEGEWLADIKRTWFSNGSLQTTIPQAIVEKLNIETGMYGLWAFDKEKLWLEPMQEDIHIGEVTQFKRGSRERFYVLVPYDMSKSLKELGELTQEVKDGKLYLRKKQDSQST
jgi:bifunctional DNA-binding transcriptional regulator/antitoxin component of YhaV-PrlF toxin-antitoxin module